MQHFKICLIFLKGIFRGEGGDLSGGKIDLDTESTLLMLFFLCLI